MTNHQTAFIIIAVCIALVVGGIYLLATEGRHPRP